MKTYSLNQTLKLLKGPTREQLIVGNQWAAVAFDKFHKNSQANIKFLIDNNEEYAVFEWDSNFSSAAMNECVDMANHGGVALAFFIMSVLKNYSYVEQTEIGDGVDYRFKKFEPDDDDLNFLDDFHYVEVSGILKESRTNTLKSRIQVKHAQIKKGGKRDMPSSVIVTLFSTPESVKENH